MNNLLKQANALLQNGSFGYAFCGGWAIDLFVGFKTRNHSDIDVFAYLSDRDAIILYMQSLGFSVYEMLGGGKAHLITDINNQKRVKRNIFCCKPDCELTCISDTDENGVCAIEFRHIGQTSLNFIEFLFNNKTETELLYARNPDIRLDLDKAVLYFDGIPYLCPEVCLLYKSTDIERDGYQHDYDTAMTKMTETQKEWLYQALVTMFPEGHKWIQGK